MASPNLSKIRHEHIRQRARQKLASRQLLDVVGSLAFIAFLSGLGAIFVGFLFFFIGTMASGDLTGRSHSLLSSYMLAFALIAVVMFIIFAGHGFSSERDLHALVAPEFAEDAELTRKEEWERTAPEREAARLASVEQQRRQQEEANRQALMRAEQERFQKQQREYDNHMRDRTKATGEAVEYLRTEFANFAMVLDLSGVTDANVIAERFALERLPILLASTPFKLGLIRSVKDQLSPSLQLVVPYLPAEPLPPAKPTPIPPNMAISSR